MTKLSTPLFLLATAVFLTAQVSAQGVGGHGRSLHRWDGTPGSSDRLGSSIANAGDVNVDGIDDFIVGMPFADFGVIRGTGAAVVISGADGSILHRLTGLEQYGHFGQAVDGAGDLDGDGHADLIVGAPFATTNEAFAFSGATGLQLHAWHTGGMADFLGGSVAGAGDVNGDGYDDVIVGARNYNYNQTSQGRAIVYSGLDGSLLHSWRGYSSEAYVGNSVAGAGDINGDGYDDVLVGAIGTSRNGRLDSGSVDLYSGADGSLLHRWNGEAAGEGLGHQVASAGDINGDGIADVMASANFASPYGINQAGSILIYSGLDGVLLHRIHGYEDDMNLGDSLAAAGDIDADGHPDLLIGAKFANGSFGTSPSTT